jgi:hypothetical protein
MPIIELANHHGNGVEYQTQDGVMIAGQFPDEVLVRYFRSDSLEIFKNWGFVSEGDFALSLPTGFETKFGQLIIGRSEAKSAPGRNVPFFPAVTAKDTQLTFSYLLLGHKKFPRLARGVFYRVMQDAGRGDIEEGFDFIQHLNRTEFLKLIELSEIAQPELAELLRRLARYQLSAMSFAVGVRQV